MEPGCAGVFSVPEAPEREKPTAENDNEYNHFSTSKRNAVYTCNIHRTYFSVMPSWRWTTTEHRSIFALMVISFLPETALMLKA